MVSNAEYLATLVHRGLGSVYLPRALLDSPGPLLLHVSDTPSGFYPVLGRLLDRLRPAWLLITGDVADEVKLELNPDLKSRYAARLAALRALLLPRLGAAPRGGAPGQGLRLLFAVGNHDDPGLLESFFPEALVVGGATRFVAGRLDCAASHWASSAAATGAEYLFYGHDLSERSRFGDGFIYLNGVAAINVLDLGSRDIYHLPYPAGTDDERLLRRKIGM